MGISRKWVGNLPDVLTTNGTIANMAAKDFWGDYLIASTIGTRRACIDAWWEKCEIVLSDKGLPFRKSMAR